MNEQNIRMINQKGDLISLRASYTGLKVFGSVDTYDKIKPATERDRRLLIDWLKTYER